MNQTIASHLISFGAKAPFLQEIQFFFIPQVTGMYSWSLSYLLGDRTCIALHCLSLNCAARLAAHAATASETHASRRPAVLPHDNHSRCVSQTVKVCAHVRKQYVYLTADWMETAKTQLPNTSLILQAMAIFTPNWKLCYA